MSAKDTARLIYAKGLYRLPLIGSLLDDVRVRRARRLRRESIDQWEEHRRNGREIIHFLHIGKTGGTAVKEALKDTTTCGNYVLALHMHNWKLAQVPPGEKVVFFLRDPVKRFISGFLNQQRQGLPRYFSAWTPDEALAFERFHSPNELALALSSEDPGLAHAAEHAMKSIKHVRSSVWEWFGDPEYFLSRKSDVLFVGFQERLNQDFESLKRILGLPISITLPGGDSAAHRTPEIGDKRLEPRAVENLLNWYAADYRFLRLCDEAVGVELPATLTSLHASRRPTRTG